MPRGDKTGPEGKGSMTGRRMGLCVGNEKARFNYNWVFGRGYARGFHRGNGKRGSSYGNRRKTFIENLADSNQSNKMMIENEIDVLKKQVEFLENELKKAN